MPEDHRDPNGFISDEAPITSTDRLRRLSNTRIAEAPLPAHEQPPVVFLRYHARWLQRLRRSGVTVLQEDIDRVLTIARQLEELGVPQ
jgi:hypothetical protein